MGYFDGSVIQAVQLSKEHSRPLVVLLAGAMAHHYRSIYARFIFLTDTGSTSSAVEEWLRSDPQIQDHLHGLQAILLRLVDGSTDFQNFTQLYPATALPTVTVVGLQGATLATISMPESAAALTAALATAREAYQKQVLSQQLLMAMLNSTQASGGAPISTPSSALETGSIPAAQPPPSTSSQTSQIAQPPPSQPSQPSQPRSQPTVTTPQRPPRPKPNKPRGPAGPPPCPPPHRTACHQAPHRQATHRTTHPPTAAV